MLFFAEKRKNFRLVPAVVFIYDSSRLLFLIALSVIFLNPEFEFKIINLPMMMFMAPNALFPLMAFFLFVHFQESRVFIPLYIIGKALCLLCVIIWMFFTLRQISDIREIRWALFLCAADLATILGTVMLNGESAPEAAILKIEVQESSIPESTITESAEGGE